MIQKVMEFKCPICKKVIPSATSEADGSKQMNARFFPFCSQRCRLIDLGAWLEGDYCIPETESRSGEDSVADR